MFPSTESTRQVEQDNRRWEAERSFIRSARRWRTDLSVGYLETYIQNGGSLRDLPKTLVNRVIRK